jgi:LAO/AO transport system kinase
VNAAPRPDIQSLAQGIRAGERRALSRAITLVESDRKDHRDSAEALLATLFSESRPAFRLGVSGPPGAGKSTFIGALGLAALDKGWRVAVLAIDPSSPVTGGSILGDKTRMEELSRDSRAYIRPSPSSGALGGATWRTREAIMLCEAAGFDLVVVETVGIGQSETAVANMVDVLLLLLAPGGGDDLQGIKKGIVEVADMVVVNKADGDLEAAAHRTAHDYQNALHLLRPPDPRWPVPVFIASALTGKNIVPIMDALDDRFRAMDRQGALSDRRRAQGLAWMWDEIRQTLALQFRHHPRIAAMLPETESAVLSGRLVPAAGAKKLINAFLDSGNTNA